MASKLRFYEEHPVFDAFSRFDAGTGRLLGIGKNDYQQAASKAPTPRSGTSEGIIRLDGDDATVFSGASSSTHTRFPRRVYFQITRNCNLQCPYCFIKARPGRPHVPIDRIRELAAFLGLNGLMEVRLTGGEPTTHPDLLAAIDAFREHDVYVSVATNGIIERNVLDAMAERRNLWVICSIDGGRQTHNHYRPGTFDKILTNLGYLKTKSPDTRLRLTTVLTRRNMHEIPALGQLTKDLGAESITIIPLRPQVRRPDARNEMIDAAQFRSVLQEMVRTIDALGVNMTTTLATDYEERIYEDPVVRKRGACAAGREATNLDFDAEREVFLVYGCSYSPACDLEAPARIRKPFTAGEFPAGEVARFADIWNDDRAWALYRDESFKSTECAQCEFFANHRCVGSCPIQNIRFEEIEADKDILDQLARQIRGTSEWYCYQRMLQTEE